ncbi:MAG TPA: glycoside hydrolase family 3, partial [Balneolaceae bacterium]|nr:glycoside hydrolase family 3 [Balneolaceae bacterium]
MIRILLSLFLLSSFFGCQQSESQPQPESEEIIDPLRLGQMIMVGFRGTELSQDSTIFEDLSKRNISGVVLFDRDVITGNRSRNIEDPTQLMHLSNDIIAATPNSP